MSLFAELKDCHQSHTPEELVQLLITRLEEQQEYNKLFDALMVQVRLKRGLPLSNPTTFEAVPSDQQTEFEEEYVNSARRVGELFLKQGSIPQGWVYLRTIGEQDKVKQALEELELEGLDQDYGDEVINVALYENAHPVRGLEVMLKIRGTCNTITACDQAMAQMSAEERVVAARLLVNHLYTELQGSLLYAIERKEEKSPELVSIRELMIDRDWLFADGNYHIDVSHLHSVVRFARFVEAGDDELDKARELTEYGTRLAEPFQYPSEAPFEEYYPAHRAFFDVLSGDGRDAGIAYFEKKVEEAADERDAAMSAYVLVDLLCRIKDYSRAIPLAEKHLKEIEDPNGFSFSRLCHLAQDYETLRTTSEANNDPVGFTLGLLGSK
ncbi:hypothetical protein Pla110_08810 [Polystyrenella longa]|uniref:Uncharacterized protein n=1 Tax=Polystyrenella longa TaxID=2528007 RepID=A0A518CIW8_9PLAN|nr:hypothetical protein [Polystyrenella longa]QDU79176.1 hypothetical protein Pla110_08810 [Polystyrenella longa]